MTDRLSGYVVTLEIDIRDDAAEAITNAIKMIKGVLSVKPIVANFETHIAYERVRQDIGRQLFEIIYEKKSP